MEDNKLPPTQSAQSDSATDSLEGTDANAPVSSYALAQKTYPIESLEVRTEGQAKLAQEMSVPTLLSVPFSRRKAVIVSIFITLAVLLIAGAASAFLVRWRASQQDTPPSQLNVPTQDLSFDDTGSDDILPELQGSEDALLVNGDFITRGNLKVVSGEFSSALATQDLTEDRTITLPNQSGVLCLDSNNCNFVTEEEFGQLVIPAPGVELLNDSAGDITLQGVTNRIIITTNNGVVTVSTPQDLAAISSPTFASLLLTSGLTVGGTIDTALNCSGLANGGTLSTNSSGHLVCADDDDSGGGGGGVTSLNSLTGALTLQGTANQINVASGGSTITLSTPQDIATTSNVIFASANFTGAVAIGSNTGGISSTNALIVNHDITGNCSFGCHGVNVVTESLVNSVLTTGVISRVHMSGGGAFSAAAFYAASNSVAGVGGITDNYGLFVDSQTVGGNDYGIYVEAADTYALWIDSGISRFDGNLEFEGATDNAFETTLAVADPTADRTITLPNATGTVCLTSGNCAGVGGTGDILNNGQNGPITIGTNNATSLFLETSNTNRVELQSDGDIAFDTDTLFVDAANNRIGIGTTAPAAPLEIAPTANPNDYTRLDYGSISFLTDAYLKAGSITQAYDLNINSDEQVTFGPTATPRLVVNINEPNGAAIHVTPQSATQVGAVIEGFSGQTADLLQFQNSSGVAMMTINSSGQLVFEGATDDTFETTLAVADPTADNTITLPNATGTVCLTSGNCAGVGGTGDILNNGQNGPVRIGTNNATDLLFETNNVDRLTIDSGGTTNINGNLAITSEASGSRVISGRFNYDTSGLGATTYFQTTEVDDDTLLSVVANGAGTTSGIVLYGNGLGGSHGIVEYESDVALNIVATNELSNSGGSINLITKPGGGGANTTRLTIDENGITTFNPTGTDSDFNIQGDTDANLFYVDASTNRIGFGDATPTATLTVGSGDLFQVAGATGDTTTSGDLAVNGGDITSSAATLNINSGGTIALQDDTTIGSNFLTGNGIRQFSSSSTEWMFEDTAGNNLLAIRDAGTTSDIEVFGQLTVDTLVDETDFDIVTNGNFYLMIDDDNNSGSGEFEIYKDGAYGASNLIYRLDNGGSITTATGSVTFLQGYLRLGVDTVSIPDSGDASPATLTYTPLASYAEFTCNDVDTCDVTMDEVGAAQGQTVYMVNMGSNSVDFANSAGVQQLSANPVALGQYDTLMLIYTTDRWIQHARSDNL